MLPRFSNAPALGGLGTEREAIAPRSGIGFGVPPRFAMLSAGRWTPPLRTCPLPICGLLGLGVMRATGDPSCKEPRPPAGGATRLTTGRAKARSGGAAADLPAFGPSIVVRVGLASTLRSGVTRLSWLGEILTAFRATDCELTSALRETAVKPFGARKLAYRICSPLCGP